MAASFTKGWSGVLQARGVVDHEPRRLELGGDLRVLELHALELGDRLAELLALGHVAEGVVERALGQADHLRADADAALVQGLDRDLVADADVADARSRRAPRSPRARARWCSNARMPSLSSFLPTVKPGSSRSTTKAVMPL